MEIDQIITELENMVMKEGSDVTIHKKEIIVLINKIKYDSKIVPQPFDDSNARLKRYVHSLFLSRL